MSELLCHIEIMKEGHHFIATTETADGKEKEYKNTVFEDMLTEILISVQENLDAMEEVVEDDA
ncbi:MAG: hypothetical protein ACPHK8_07330 [Thermoplasmatota archaeon]